MGQIMLADSNLSEIDSILRRLTLWVDMKWKDNVASTASSATKKVGS